MDVHGTKNASTSAKNSKPEIPHLGFLKVNGKTATGFNTAQSVLLLRTVFCLLSQILLI